MRIEKAAWLLRHTNKNLTDIAEEAGFSNSNYFIKVFRSFIGITPYDYRVGKKTTVANNLRIEL